MRFEDVQQNTPEWLELRKRYIGASDTPIILGVSEFKTPFQLWQEKTGQVESNFESFATSKGHNLEDIARMHHEQLTGIATKACTFTHPIHTWLSCSLDGWNSEERLVLEIKCLGKEKHQMAIDGKVPEMYWWQVQHQLLASGGKVAHYFSFDGEDGALVYVHPDHDAFERIIKESGEFFARISSMVAPELCDQDTKVVNDPYFTELVQKYRANASLLKKHKDMDEVLKKEIGMLMSHPRMICDDLQITTITRTGSVEYKKVPELQGVDLNNYRKKPSSYLKFSDKRK